MEQLHSGIEMYPISAPARRPQGLDSVDAAFDEFCKLRETGNDIDPEEFCGRYPTCQSSLRRAVNAMLLMEENPSFLAPPTPVRWPQPGERFLKWVLDEELGKGGFARVYRAHQPALGNRSVVLKLSPGGSGEAWTLGRLNHAHIVPILDIEEAPGAGLTAVCLPYLGRATLCDVLDRLLARPELPTRAAVILEAIARPGEEAAAPARQLTEGSYIEGVLYLGEQMAQALVYLHEQQVAHRDLKPSNVLLTPTGEVKLLDFNLAHDHASGRRPLGGTPAYMAPEQLAALSEPAGPQTEAPFSPAPDVFALGVVLYELLAAQHPFGPLPLNRTEDERRDLLRQSHARGATPLTTINAQVPPALAQLVERCLATDPTQRPASAAELLRELQRCRPAPVPQARSRRRLWAGVAASVAVVAFAAAAFGTTSNRDKPAEAGRKAFKEGDYDRAAQHYEKALKDDPQSPELLLAMGRTQQRRSDYPSALQYLKQANDKQDDPRIQAAYAYCLAEKNELPAAIFEGRKAIKSDKASPAVWLNLGYCLIQVNELAEARECIDKALKLDPKLSTAYHISAIQELTFAMRDEHKKYIPSRGIADIEKTLALGRKEWRVYYHGAYLCALASKRGTDKKDQGVEWLRTALALGMSGQEAANSINLADLVKHITEEELNKATQNAKEQPKTYLLDPLADE